MRTTDVDVILQTFDEAANKRKAIMSLSKLLSVTPEEIMEKLQQNGRSIAVAEPKKKPAPKEPEAYVIDKSQKPSSENIVKAEAPGQQSLPMPEYVQDILFKEFSSLEQRIGELTVELEKTKEHYVVVKKYLFGD